MEVETAYQKALSQLELDYRQRMQEIALENERLRQEEERARAQARSDNEMMLMWATFIVDAPALVVLTAAGAYYLIMRARIPYPQATGQLPRQACGAPVKIFSARARHGKASPSWR